MIGWAEARWRFRRGRAAYPDTQGVIALEFLGRADDALIDSVVEYHAALVGEPRSANDPADLEELVGDYRLARGLAATLTEWYRYRAVTFEDAAAAAGPRLRAHGIERSADLRRRLWEAANRSGGFANGEVRARLIATVAAEIGVEAAAIEGLIWLDHDRAATLEAVDARPSAERVRLAYNRHLLTAALLRADLVAVTAPTLDGATARRLLARCRRLGLVCDVESTDDAATEQLRIVLFGRPEAVGPSGGAGRRLASTTVDLLRSTTVEGHARIAIGQRRYALPLDRIVVEAIGGRLAREAPASYDSAAEARLHREWQVAAARGDHAGWQLEREPALLAVGGHIMAPDFCLDRDAQRIYVELIGFWTPEYVERKRRKLRAVATAGLPFLVGVDTALREDFTGLDLPTVWYDGELSWADLRLAAERFFGRRDRRLDHASDRLPAVLRDGEPHDLIPELALARDLGLHSADELAALLTARLAAMGEWRWLRGVGLIKTMALQAVAAELQAQLAQSGAMPLPIAVLWLADRLHVSEGAAEAALNALPGVAVDWTDLFAPAVRLASP